MKSGFKWALVGDWVGGGTLGPWGFTDLRSGVAYEPFGTAAVCCGLTAGCRKAELSCEFTS